MGYGEYNRTSDMPDEDEYWTGVNYVKDAATTYAKNRRIKEGRNRDEVDNRYDAIRHIGGTMGLLQKYPDWAASAMLSANEFMSTPGASKDMDEHNNKVGTELYNSLSDEDKEGMSMNDLMELAEAHLTEVERAEQSGELDDIPESLRPVYSFKEGTIPEYNEGGFISSQGINPKREQGVMPTEEEQMNMALGGLAQSQKGITTQAGKDMANARFQLDLSKADKDKDGKITPHERASAEAVQKALANDEIVDMREGGLMTSADRMVYQDEDGENYSEKTITLETADGWVNIPSVDAEGGIMSDEELEAFLEENGPVDPVTGAPLDTYPTVEEAVEAAQMRTDDLSDEVSEGMPEDELPELNCGGLMSGMAGVDMETGNDIPIGSSAENVRDDLPAKLSDGEYVLPAHVVKWIGLSHIQDMQAEAEMGLMGMEMEGLLPSTEPMDEYKEEEKDEGTEEEEERDEADVEVATVKVDDKLDGSDEVKEEKPKEHKLTISKKQNYRFR